MLLILLAVFIFLADQFSKYLVRESLALYESFPREGFLRITHTFNTGSIFGLFQGYNTPLILLSFAGVAVLILLYHTQRFPIGLLRLSLGLQLGGAFGNLVDRVRLGHVTDWIDVGPWPVFNVADSSIVTGLVILAWVFILAERSSTAATPPGPWGDDCPVCDGAMRALPQGGWRCSTCGAPRADTVGLVHPVRRAAAVSRAGADFGQVSLLEFQARETGGRLDQYLAQSGLGLTRSRLRQLIADGNVLVNGAAAKPSHRLRPGDRVSVSVPAPRPSIAVPQDIPLTVVYQDANLVVIDKPAGLAAHPGPGHPDQTLVNGLLALCPDIQGIGGEIRPGIVHRLDKDTSGLMIAAKTELAHHSLSQQIKDRAVQKGYLALVTGSPPQESGMIDAPIGRDPRRRTRMAVTAGGRESRTGYRLLERAGRYSLLELQLHTGRTHQARVHLAWLDHPLLGDSVYGRSSPLLPRHFLHAHTMAFAHPASGEPMRFVSPLPPDLQAALEAARRGGG